MAALSTKAILPLVLLQCLTPAAFADSARFEKYQAVAKYLEFYDAHDYSADLRPWDGAQTRQGFETILKYMDPRGELKRYFRWNDNEVVLYQDRDTRNAEDVRLAFRNDGGVPTDPLHWIDKIRDAARNSPSAQPLQGLRIALDPGHMGGRLWDLKTGKFVHTSAGYVSEGVINFQVCMLLRRELEKLGAETMITRNGLKPVSTLDPAKFDIKPFARGDLAASTDFPWFDQLLASAPLGRRLLSQVNRSVRVHGYFSESLRDTYFISRADLRARADLINGFKPDLTLVIHFDAAKTTATQNNGEAVRGYVEGNLMPNEAATREIRADILQALVDGHRWLESSVFTAWVTKGISDAAHVQMLDTAEDFGAIRVAKGVYARNLALTRLGKRGIATYIEVLNYDYLPEAPAPEDG